MKLYVSFAKYRLFYRALLQKIFIDFVYQHLHIDDVYEHERWGAGVQYHFQEFNEPYAPS